MRTQKKDGYTAADLRAGSVMEVEVFEDDGGHGVREVTKEVTVKRVSPYFAWFTGSRTGGRQKLTTLDVDILAGNKKIISI